MHIQNTKLANPDARVLAELQKQTQLMQEILKTLNRLAQTD